MVHQPDFVKWEEKFSVGVAVLDAQHRQVITILNDIHRHIKNQGEHDTLKKILIKLRIFTETHFRYEEVLIKVSEYPDFDAHRKYHSQMVGETISITRSILKGASNLQDLLVFLRKWWINHILEHDKKYIPYILKLELE